MNLAGIAHASSPPAKTGWSVAAALLAVALGCARQPYPREPVVEELEIVGVEDSEADRLREGLATQESGRLLYIWDGIAHDYETFDASVLELDIERAERFMRARGYYEARVTKARVQRTDEHHVRVRVFLDKGQPVLTRRIQLTGMQEVDIAVATAALTSIKLETDQPFDEDAFEESKTEITNALANGGYAYSKVDGNATVDISGRNADVVFAVVPGPKARIGRVSIVGLDEIADAPVREALSVEEGDPYSRQELEDARRAVFDLGVFSRVVIDQDLSQADKAVVPIVLRVSESSLRNLTLGIGGRMDVEQTIGYLKASWVHRNFLGGLRRLTISERPGMTAYPTRIDYLERPTRGLFENDLSVELRQPSLFEARTAGWTRARYSIYPLLYPLPEPLPSGLGPQDWPIIGYHDVGTSVGLDRSFFGNHLIGSISYHWNANVPRSYQASAAAVAALDNVYVSFPELSVALDFRDDPVAPTRGIYLSNSVQMANPLLNGTVSDFRVQSGLRTFYPLSSDGDVVLATRVKFGFVFPSNYGQTFDKNDGASRRLFTNPEDPSVTDDQQKILFRAFYSGGPNSNRGYAYRQVGSQGPIGFLLPSLRGQDCALAAEPGTLPDPLPAECLRTLGGFSLWEASMEIRFPVAGDLYGTLFVDASDVSQEVAFVAFDSPHISVGPGLRYRTPIGPLRLDIGYRIPGLQVRGSSDADPPRFFPDIAELEEFKARAPFAYHIAIGEAF